MVEIYQVMTDSELCGFSKEHKVSTPREKTSMGAIDISSIQSCNQYIKHADDAFMKSAKVAMLLEKLEQCKREGRRMLLFSQVRRSLLPKTYML
jgi:hypothetical protein